MQFANVLRHFFSLCIGFVIWLAVLPAQATPLLPEQVPASLQAWTDWVLQKQPDRLCPYVFTDKAQTTHQCYWPSYLSLSVTEQQAEFSQQWQVFRAGWVPLVGRSLTANPHWPQAVQVDGKAAVVVDRKGEPWLWLPVGEHVVTGQFVWTLRPEALQIPAETGLVKLSINGQDIAQPRLDRQGRLWLQTPRTDSSSADENQLSLRVYRHIIDDIPLRTVTRLVLEVAGRHREVSLGPVLLNAHIPMQLVSSLPARLEPNGLLRLQVRPGTWQITIDSHHQGNAEQLSSAALAQPQAEWVSEELWAFEARPHLRLVEVDGLNVIDPQQTNLPEEWRQFPTYQVTAKDMMNLIEKRRGDTEPAPDQLELTRHFWLDFDGRGYSIQDQISGQLSKGWRLEMAHSNPEALQQEDGIEVGRVSVNQQDQFITRLTPDSNMGVEVRQGTLNLLADSRLNSGLTTLPAVSWLHGDAEQSQFQQVNAVLHLPPGWSLFNATGMDSVSQTWLQNWSSLLDVFVVLILSLAVAKLWGSLWGVLTLLTLVLSYHHQPALPWVWMQVIAALALLRVLPSMGVLHWWVKTYRNLSLVALLILVIPFLIQEVRVSFFPQLSMPWVHLSEDAYFANNDNYATATVVQNTNNLDYEEAADYAPAARSRAITDLSIGQEKDVYKNKKVDKPLLQIDPNAYVQTGLGVPRWQWQRIDMNWSGPVSYDQQITLSLLSPAWNQALGLIRAALVLCLMGFFLWLSWAKSARQFFYQAHVKTGLTALALAAVLLPSMWPQDSMAQNFPPETLLQELQQRLLASPECVPYCISSPQANVQIQDDRLTIWQQVHSVINTAIPLAGQDQHWLPQHILLNDQPASALRRDSDGQLWLQIPKGIHHLQLIGSVPLRNSWQLPFPLKPKHITVNADDWQVEGLRDNGQIDSALQFTRRQENAEVSNAPLEMGSLPALLQVERTLLLGLEWQVQTVVTRLTPLGSAVVLDVPLLVGESVTSERINVTQGRVKLTLSPNQTQLQWTSSLQQQADLTLTASKQSNIVEVWRLEASAIWHVDVDGIPVVYHQRDGHWSPEWRPFAGETVSLHLKRPLGVEGQVLTIDNSVLSVHPGRRNTDYQLNLSIRSSRGARHIITLPEAADLQSVSINGTTQPIQQQDQRIILPISPGAQTVELHFREARGLEQYFSTPRIDLGSDSVNSQIEIYPPDERWILFTGGDAIGPGVLIWGILLVMVMLSAGLGQIRLTPLKTHHWLLLSLVLTPLSTASALAVIGWLLVLGWRQSLIQVPNRWQFDFLQLALLAWTGVALLILLAGIEQGLLGQPNMHIAGNASSSYQLRWYQDRIGHELPQVWLFSLSIWVYRFLMLCWALWLSFALLRWMRWGWHSFSYQGLWQPLWQRKQHPVAAESESVKTKTDS